MTLHEYIVEEQRKLEAFEKYYAKCWDKDPELYPLENTPGDWDEQFIAYCNDLND